MKTWYLNHYAASSSVPREGRSYFLSRGILNANSSCSVITASFHHLQRGNQAPQESNFKVKIVDGIPFLWVKTPQYKGNGLRRILNMLSYAYSCWKFDFVQLNELEKPDVIIVSSGHPFHLLAGLKWSKRYNAKLVFEVRDLWPLSLNLLVGISKWHPLSLVLSFLERLAYKRADLVVSLLPNALEYMEPLGVSPNRFLYVPNGYVDDFMWSSSSVLEESLKEIRGRYSRVIMHLGSMGPPNGLESLVNAANQLKGNADVAFVFIGDGVLKKELVCVSNSPHIYYFDPVLKDQVQSVLTYSDICYCGFQYLPSLYKFGVSPNKVFDYMLAKKFVLLGVASPNNPVEKAGAGICFEPSSDEHVFKTLQNVLSLTDEELTEKGVSGYEYLIEEHNFNNLAVKLLNKIDSLDYVSHQ